MTLKGSTSQACAACKYQRRRCLPECKLAPYFPSDKPKTFQNVHRLYGVSNILKILKLVDVSQRSEAVRSIIYESDMRQKYPVLGCYGIVQHLAYQVRILEEQLHGKKLQLEFYKLEQQQQNSTNLLVLHDDQNKIGSFSLLQLEMAPPDNADHNNDREEGFSFCNTDDQLWSIQQPVEGDIVLKNDNNLMDQFEMSSEHHQLQPYLFDVHSQQQDLMNHFENMDPFLDCGGQSSFIDSKIAHELSSGSDDQSPSLQGRMDAAGHQVTESHDFQNEGTCFGK